MFLKKTLKKNNDDKTLKLKLLQQQKKTMKKVKTHILTILQFEPKNLLFSHLFFI